MKYIVTCEHGGNQVPEEYKELFKDSSARLKSHEGLDIGVLKLAKAFAKNADYFFYTEVSRLVVELNRIIHHPQLLSDITKQLSPAEKKSLITRYYLPYRNGVTEAIAESIKEGESVVHLSVHSFTPVLNNEERKTDIGLLYDPKRKREKEFCKLWKENVKTLNDILRVRFNYPYLGISDGFVTELRKKFPETKYIGIELEVNQKLLMDEQHYKKLEETLVNSFEHILSLTSYKN